MWAHSMGVQAWVKYAIKTAKTSRLVTSPQENPKPKTEKKFLTRNY